MCDYQEREAAVLFKGNPATLLGPEIKVGDAAPDFQVVDNGLAPVTLATDAGKVRLITVVPSLDTPVWIRAYIEEPNLGRISPGMAAQVYTDSRPQQPYPAKVGFISPEAEFTPKTVQTEELRTRLVYKVRIIAEPTDQGLRQGMPVTVKLLEDQRLKGSE